MVKKPSNSDETTVTRITAKDTGSKHAKDKPTKAENAKTATKVKPAINAKKHSIIAKAEKRATNRSKNPFVAIGRYFKGAWEELKLVRWPDRAATWKMTGALLVFTLFFVVLIVLLDFGFAKLFKLILGTA